MRFDGDDDRGRPYHPTDLERRRRAAEEEWAQQRVLGRLCCPLAPVLGAGHSHDCPNHEPASCPTCQEEK